MAIEGMTDAPVADTSAADEVSYESIVKKWDATLSEADDADAVAAILKEPESEDESPVEAEAAAVETPAEPAQAAPAPVIEDLLAKARQEAEARAQQKQSRNFEQEIAQAKAEAEALKSRLARNPLEVIKEIGLNPIDLANYAYAEALGEDAPQEFRDKLNQTALERKVEDKLRELERREQEWQQAQQQRETQALIAQLDNELVASVHNVPESFSLMKQAAAQDQTYAYEALVEATNQYFQASGGRLPTAQQAMQIAEAGLERLARLFKAQQKSDAPTQATEGRETRKQSPTKTLSDTDTAEKPSRRAAQPEARDTDAWIRGALRKTVEKPK
jgi:hypothetical protein